MISYVTIGSNDLAASAAFFDIVFGAVGGETQFKLDHMIAYTFGKNTPMVLVTRPHDGQAATNGNGAMIALAAKDRAHVDQVHALALKAGAVDEGAPGERGAQFYGAYFRDLDGNKFNISLMS